MKTDGCLLVGPTGVGIIKKILGDLGLGPREGLVVDQEGDEIQDTEKIIPNPVSDQKRRFKSGELLDLILEVANIENRPREEFEKICKVANERGFEVNMGSVQACFYKARRELLIDSTHKQATPPTTPNISELSQPQQVQADSLDRSKRLQLALGEFTAILRENEDLRKRLDKAETRLKKLEEKNLHLKEAENELRTIKDVLKQFRK